jgi:hypothetical protein
MEAKVTRKEQGLEIHIRELEGKKDQLLEAFEECSEGRCTCPTQEYQKMERLEIAGSDDTIELSIKAKEGEEINAAEIEKCLKYTEQRVAETQDEES